MGAKEWGKQREGARARGRATAGRRGGGDSFESKQGQVGRTRDSHRRRRDNGSNELTRTPEPRLSLSSRRCPSPPRSSPDHRALSVSFPLSLSRSLPSPRSFPCRPLLQRVSHSFSSFCTTTTTVAAESNPICHLRSFSPRLTARSFSLSFARFGNACARKYSRPLSLSLALCSPSLASGPV